MERQCMIQLLELTLLFTNAMFGIVDDEGQYENYFYCLMCDQSVCMFRVTIECSEHLTMPMNVDFSTSVVTNIT